MGKSKLENIFQSQICYIWLENKRNRSHQKLRKFKIGSRWNFLIRFFSLAYVTFIGLSTVSLNMLNVLPLSLFVNRVGGTLEGSERPTDQLGQLHQRQK